MYEKPCNCSRTAIQFMGGGGGGSSINVPSLGSEIKQTVQGFNQQVNPTFQKWASNEPLLNQLSQYGMSAQQQFAGVPGQLLQGAQQFAGVPGQYLGIANSLAPIAQTGQLTQDQINQATQTARAGYQARGDVFSNPAAFTEALNRQQYSSARQQQAIGEMTGLGNAAMGIQVGIGGLSQGAQGIAQGGEQLLGYPEQQRTGNFATLANPLYGLAAAQLAAQTQGQIAGAEAQSANKAGTSSLAGSGLMAAGTAVAGIAI